MKLLPRLIKTTILIAIGERVVSSNSSCRVQTGMKEVDVEIWEEVGLAIHCNSLDQDTWKVSHVSSGRYVLHNIKNRKEAIQYMLKIKEWKTAERINIDWMMSEQQFNTLHNREEVIQTVSELQREINEGK